MKRFTVLVVLLAVLVVSGAATAGPIGYAIANDSRLYSIDFGLGAATQIGPMGVFLEGIAIDGAGNLYGTDTGGRLYSIDSSNGATALIGSSNLGNLEGLDFNGGRLITSTFGSTPRLYSLDTTDGSPTLLATADTSTGSVRSMTTLDANTMLIRTDVGDTLRTINLATGATAILARSLPEIYGMDFLSDGGLYGLSHFGVLLSIDPNTGQTTQIGDTGDQFWLGLAAAQVPEPATVILMGLGLVALRLRRRGRAR